MQMKFFDANGGRLLAEEAMLLRVLPGGAVEFYADSQQPPAGAAWIEIWDGSQRVMRGPCEVVDDERLTHDQAGELLARIAAGLNAAD